MEGGVASGFRTPEEEKFETRLYICRGKRVVRLKQVPILKFEFYMFPTGVQTDDVEVIIKCVFGIVGSLCSLIIES